jgi:adenine phosphoribosyltransferase
MVAMGTELRDHLVRAFRWVDPGPASTHLVSDVSGWWRDPVILAGIGPALAEPFQIGPPTVVLAPERAGLLLGPLVAVALGVGFVPAHKGAPVPDGAPHDHLPGGTAPREHVPDGTVRPGGTAQPDHGIAASYAGADGRRIAEPTAWARTAPDYRGRSLALGVRHRHLAPGDRVLVVDDWVSTGAQIRALHRLITVCGASLAGTAAVVADCPPELTRELRLRALLDPADIEPGARGADQVSG